MPDTQISPYAKVGGGGGQFSSFGVSALNTQGGGQLPSYSDQLGQGYTQAGGAQSVGQGLMNSKAPGQAGQFLTYMKYGYQGAKMTLNQFLVFHQAKQQKRILGWQAELQDIQTKALQTAADDAMRAGHQAIAATTYRYGQQKSSTRVAMAASGVRVGGQGSSAEVLASQDIAKQMEVAQLYANAVAQAFGYRKQAVNSQNQALAIRAAQRSISPWAAAITTSISNALNGTSMVGDMNFSGGQKQSTTKISPDKWGVTQKDIGQASSSSSSWGVGFNSSSSGMASVFGGGK